MPVPVVPGICKRALLGGPEVGEKDRGLAVAGADDRGEGRGAIAGLRVGVGLDASKAGAAPARREAQTFSLCGVRDRQVGPGTHRGYPTRA